MDVLYPICSNNWVGNVRSEAKLRISQLSVYCTCAICDVHALIWYTEKDWFNLCFSG